MVNLKEKSGNEIEDKIKTELEEVKNLTKKFQIEDIKNGTWFIDLLRYSMKNYLEKVDAEYFKNKYPDLPPDAIAQRRINLAKKYAGIVGATTASAYSAAIASTIGTKGGASPLTIPAAATSFITDLFFTTRLQIHLTYDLSVIYNYSIDFEDPEDLIDFFRVAFGVKAGEQARSSISKLAPEGTRVLTKRTIKGSILEVLKRTPVIGKYLLQRNIIKFAIPVVSIITNAGVNYYSTDLIAKVAKEIYRDKAVIREVSFDIVESIDYSMTDLFLRTIYLVMQSDGKIQNSESWMLKEILEQYTNNDVHKIMLNKFKSMVQVDKNTILKEINELDPHNKQSLFKAAIYAASIDHKITKNEKILLKIIADTCDINFDINEVKASAKY